MGIGLGVATRYMPSKHKRISLAVIAHRTRYMPSKDNQLYAKQTQANAFLRLKAGSCDKLRTAHSADDKHGDNRSGPIC